MNPKLRSTRELQSQQKLGLPDHFVADFQTILATGEGQQHALLGVAEVPEWSDSANKEHHVALFFVVGPTDEKSRADATIDKFTLRFAPSLARKLACALLLAAEKGD